MGKSFHQVLKRNRSGLMRAAVVWLLLGLFAIRPGSAEDGMVRFCFNEWPPYTVMVDGEPRGISIEILQEATRRSGLRASFQELPWNRCLQGVRDGILDAVIDAAKRDEFLQGPTSFSVYTNTFWVREDDAVQSFDLTLLAKHKIGLVHGYVYPDALADTLRSPHYEIEYSVDDPVNVRKLAFNRVDTIIADFISTSEFARENGLKIRPLLPSHSFDRLYVSFRKDKSVLHSKIDTAIATLIAEGFVGKLYRKRFNVSFDELLDIRPSAQ